MDGAPIGAPPPFALFSVCLPVLFPDAVQHDRGAPLIRNRFRLCDCEGPGSAAHHYAALRPGHATVAWQDSGAKARRENGFALENETHMKNKYPSGMSYTEWKRTPFRVRHWLVGRAINNALRYWQTCANARCGRAGLSGFHLLLAAATGIIVRGRSAGAQARRAAGQAFVDRLHFGLGRPSALLSENYAAVCASAVRSIACAR
jgi:hypothetical protein